MNTDFGETDEIIRRLARGDAQGLDELFSRHRERLKRMVWYRLDPRLRGRVDDSDVIQETYLEASRRLPEHVHDPRVPFFVWLRSIAGQKLIDLHRYHLGAQVRDVRREANLQRAPMPQATSAVLAAQLLGTIKTPSQIAIQAEFEERIREALECMEPKDREVLILRHFESLTNAETAHELGIKVSAASRRYIRALKKLKDILARIPGNTGETWTGPTA